MGTSSILIAAILAVLKTLMGKPYTNDDLFYETLDVEQMMNTGTLLIDGFCARCKNFFSF
jgi:galactokinase/mevalonate kinase-like predicted kinase